MAMLHDQAYNQRGRGRGLLLGLLLSRIGVKDEGRMEKINKKNKIKEVKKREKNILQLQKVK